MQEDKPFVTLARQVEELLSEIDMGFDMDVVTDDELRETLELLANKSGDSYRNTPARVADEVFRGFHCDDYPTQHLAKTALKWLGPKKEKEQQKPKRKYTKRKTK